MGLGAVCGESSEAEPGSKKVMAVTILFRSFDPRGQTFREMEACTVASYSRFSKSKSYAPPD